MNSTPPSSSRTLGVNAVSRITARIQVLMQRRWLLGFAVRIAAHEPSSCGIVVACAEVVEAEVGVVQFAAIEIAVGVVPVTFNS